MTPITRELVNEVTAKQALVAMACPSCGNTTAGGGISNWQYVTRVAAVLGTFNGIAVTADDSEENDFDMPAGGSLPRTSGFHCNKCRHEWDDTGDIVALCGVVAELGVRKTLDRMARDGWETVAACGGDVRTGDAIVVGTTIYEITATRTIDDRIICEYGPRGNGGTVVVTTYEEVRLLRRKPERTVPTDVVTFLTHAVRGNQHRITLSGLRNELETYYEKRSVYRFLDAWTAGQPLPECWPHLRPKEA